MSDNDLRKKDSLVLTLDDTPVSSDILNKIRAVPPEQLLIVADRNHTLYGTGMAPPHIPPLLSEIYRVTNGGLVMLTSTEVERTDEVFGGSVCAVIGDYGMTRRLTKAGQIEHLDSDGNVLAPKGYFGDEPYYPEQYNLSAFTKENALHQAIQYHQPWQGRIMIGLGDDPGMDRGFLRYIHEAGGYAFEVKNQKSGSNKPIPGTRATLKDTESAIALLRAIFYGKISEPDSAPPHDKFTKQEARRQFLAQRKHRAGPKPSDSIE